MESMLRKLLLLLTISICWAVRTEAAAAAAEEYMKYKDPKQPLSARIKDLLRRMTLAEKIGQMSQIERQIATPDVLQNYFIGIYRSLLPDGDSFDLPEERTNSII